MNLIAQIKQALCQRGCLSRMHDGKCSTPDGTCLIDSAMERTAKEILDLIDNSKTHRIVPVEMTDAMVDAAIAPYRYKNLEEFNQIYRECVRGYWTAALNTYKRDT